jgi:hypothetical protein
MESMLNRLAAGKAGRFGKWYALAHAARCTPCRHFLERLEAMLDTLKQTKGADPDAATIERLMLTADTTES